MAAVELGKRYDLLRPLGSGGIGDVFLVRDRAEQSICALKRLKPETRSRQAKLRDEFETLTSLNHPTIVSVHHFGSTPDQSPYYTMEYVPSSSPKEAIGSRGGWTRVLRIGRDIAHGLEVLHGKGIVHGDLKPSNVLITVDDHSITSVRLVDFGLACALGDLEGARRGTWGFAAPEVLHRSAPTAASDLYSLGVTLYTLGYGRQPFRGQNAEAVLQQQLHGWVDRTALAKAGAPEALIEILLQLLAVDPADRLQSARQLRRELESIDPAVASDLPQRLENAVLVGRERELGTIERFLGRPFSRSHMFVVAGPRGSGKSAFLREVISHANLAGHPVMRWPVSHEPVAPFIEGLAANSDRFVAVIDDAHLLGDSDHALLRELILQPRKRPILIVLGKDRSHALLKEEQLLRSAGALDVIELQPLSRDGVTRLLAARLREPAPAALSDFVFARTQGHPGFSVDVLKQAAQAGVVQESDAGLIVDEEGLERLSLPSSFEESQSACLEGLSPSARSAMAALAVAKSATEQELMRMDPSIEPGSMAPLMASGLCVEEGGRYRLLSALVVPPTSADRLALHRAALDVLQLTPAERFWHLQAAGRDREAVEVAECLSSDEDPAIAAAAGEIAQKFDTTLAAMWYERAARFLFARGRYESAVPALERSLELDRTPALQAERLYLLSSAHLRCGNAAGAEVAVATALGLDPATGLRSRLVTNEAARLHVTGNLGMAEEAGRAALGMALEAGDREAEAMAANALVYILLAAGRAATAEAMAQQAVEASLSTDSRFVRIRAEGAAAAVAHRRGDLDGAAERYGRALSLARDRGPRVLVEELLINLSTVLTDLGEWGQVRQANAEAFRLALGDHRPRNAAVALANLAHTDVLLGHVRAARRESRRAVTLCHDHLPALESSAWRALARANRYGGRPLAAERAARNAHEISLEHGSQEEIGWSALEYGLALAQQGSAGEAVLIWRKAREKLTADSYSLQCLLACSVGIEQLRRGQVSEARLEIGSVEAIRAAGHKLSSMAEGLALRLDAELEAATGVLDDAITAAGKVLAHFERMPAPAEYAATATRLAELFLEHAECARAPLGPWLNKAEQIYQRIGDLASHKRVIQQQVRWYQAREDSAHRVRDHRAIVDAISELVVAGLDDAKFCQHAIDFIVDQLGAEYGALLLNDPDTEDLEPIAERGCGDGMLRRKACTYSRRTVQKVARGNRSLLVADASNDPRALSGSVHDLRLRSILCVPLRHGEQVLGAAYLDDTRRARSFSAEDQELLEHIGQLLSGAIARNRAEREAARIAAVLTDENRALRDTVEASLKVDELIGTSAAMQKIRMLIERAAGTKMPVLVTGESGTGKELIARAIHRLSARRHRHFLPVNSGAISDGMADSEISGIERGRATNVDQHEGWFTSTDGGTLFLDEIGDMPFHLQSKLLRVLQDGEVRKVGSNKIEKVDVRVIAATNQDLERLVEERRFRPDLRARLNGFPIEVPPLRERKEDIPTLARYFAERFAAAEKRPLPKLGREFLSALMQSNWPDNVRGLRYYVERMIVLTPGKELFPNPLPDDLEKRVGQRVVRRGKLKDQLAAIERDILVRTLFRHEGNQSRAGRELGINESVMRYKLQQHGVPGTRKKSRKSRKDADTE